MNGSIGFGNSNFVKNKKHSGKYNRRVPYPRKIQAVNSLEKILAGRPGENSRNQAGNPKLKEGGLRRKVCHPGCGMEKGVKRIGKLGRKGLDGTDPHINGKTSWQVAYHHAAEYKKEQDKGQQEKSIHIHPEQSTEAGTQDGIGNQNNPGQNDRLTGCVP